MITSMTGFGRAEVNQNGFLVTTEMRSLNHRFLDIDLRLPKELSIFEPKIRELLSRGLVRGRVSIVVVIRGVDAPVVGFSIDKALASRYVDLAKDLKHEFGLSGMLEVQQLMSLPEIVCFEGPENPDDGIWDAVKQSIQGALKELGKMRQREGQEISGDLQTRLANLSRLVILVEQHASKNAKEAYGKLRKKVETLAGNEIVDEGRLEMEVALLADKVDVTEECIRFKSHNTLFAELLKSDNSEGRRLNFLLQEMHREANTIGAKSNDSQISHWVVDVKEDIEKLREQIQNIE